jgi:thiosulfate reductase cytochrome b subunit
MSAALASGSGWIAFALIPIGACAGWLIRRFVKGPFRRRMRPHYALGYGALVVALLHVALETRSSAGADVVGLRLATLALIGLALQALVGSNLQSPGDYRKVLRRWHLVTFAAIALFVTGHVLLNR